MKYLCTFQEATEEDLQEMLGLLDKHPAIYKYVDFLLNWTEGENQVSGHLNVIEWMRYYVTHYTSSLP